MSGKVVSKPGTVVPEEACIDIKGGGRTFASKGGDKLNAALQYFGLDVSGKTCLDVGASTGGFTDCLLKRDAGRVYAVENGKNQLAFALQDDARVISMEETDIRNISGDWFDDVISVVTVDVSFISLTKILEPIIAILNPGTDMICLIKPQFEAGKSNVNKRGLVRDLKIRQSAIDNVCTYALSLGLELVGIMPYPEVAPKDKNQEFLAYFKKQKA